MPYYFEFQEYRLRNEEPKQYNNLKYQYSIHTKDDRLDYYYSKSYVTFREVLREYHRIIVKTGQHPKPCFYFNYELMSQSKDLYNFYVKNIESKAFCKLYKSIMQ